MIDSVFSTCVRMASWALDPPVMEPESVKDKLGIYHFASPRIDTVTYQERTAAGRITLRQEQAGEDKSKVNRKASDLYCQGKMESADHVITMLANFWVFCTFAIEDFTTNPPAIWQGINDYILRLKSPQGKNWTNKHANCQHVFYHMVGDLQNMLCPFTNISNNYTYRTQVKNNLLIAPQAYEEAMSHAKYQVVRLNNILVSADLGDYRDVPPIMSLLAKHLSDGSKQTTTPIKPAQAYQGSGNHEISKSVKFVTPEYKNQQKKQSRNDTNPELTQDKINEKKTQGLVKFTGTGKPPIANDILVVHP
jgi:hypothetical protein